MTNERVLLLAAKIFAATIFAATTACAPEPAWTTVTLALGETPERVSTISISVRDLDSNALATSATIAVPKTSISLGVPAETPLELSAIARTSQPGPQTIGTMPAYLGRTERTIALGREQELVSITVHRAGVLTVKTAIEGDDKGLLGFRLEPEDKDDRATELGDVDKILDPRSLILRTGRYDAFVVERIKNNPFLRTIAPSRGIYVAPEIESLLLLTFREKPPAPLPNDAIVLSIDTGGDLETEPGMNAELPLAFDAKDARGQSVSIPQAMLRVRVSADPFTALATPGMIEVVGLPAQVPEVLFRAMGRAVIRARATLPDGRILNAVRALNVLPRSVSAGNASRLVLSIEDPELLAEGTALEASLLDARGLFASAPTGALDLSTSDPWAFFPAGPTAAVSTADRGFVRRELSRPSGPRGLPVGVRATLTSTATMVTLTASVALPLLELR